MYVNQVMTRGAECIQPGATIREAAERMKTLDVGALPVCENDRLIGMLTDRDIVVRCISAGRDPRTEHVRDAMSPEVFYCLEDQDINEAAGIMMEKQVRRLAVLNRQQRLAGILSLGDLALEAGDGQLAGETLGVISEPTFNL
jgi:CBS domain-containing protein